MEQKKHFRNPNGGRRYLQGLFFETSLDKETVLYTLKEQDHLGYPSLRRLYLEAKDPTEYTFACSHLESWSHWVELSSAEWFKPFCEEWRQELDTLLRSQAVRKVIEISLSDSHPATFSANKYLLEALGKPTGASKRGRPSKDEVKAELKRLATAEAEIQDDAKRLGIN